MLSCSLSESFITISNVPFITFQRSVSRSRTSDKVMQNPSFRLSATGGLSFYVRNDFKKMPFPTLGREGD